MFESIWNWMVSNAELSIFLVMFLGSVLVFLLNYIERRTGINTDAGEVIIKKAEAEIVTKLEQTHKNIHHRSKQNNEHADGFRVIGAVKKSEEPKEVVVENKETNSETKEDNQDEESDSHRDNTIINSGLV